jgi:hypothetical protein
MEICEPIDANGNDLNLGDWVRVIAVPLSIQNMPQDSKEAFNRAVGETLQIEGFNEAGCIELDFTYKFGSLDTIWLEPYLCIRFRRYKKPSKRFLEIQRINKKIDEKSVT